MTLSRLYRLAASAGLVSSPSRADLASAKRHLAAAGGLIRGREATCLSISIALASGKTFAAALLLADEIEKLTK